MTQYYSQTDINYAGDSNFTIPFSYIDKDDISVYVNDELITTWTWLNDSQINVTSTLTTGDVISIRRNTPINEKIVTYQNMSMVLSDDNLNLSQDQLLNAVQEMRDGNVTFQLDVDSAFEEYKNTINSEIDAIDDKADLAISTANTAENKAGSAIATATSASETADSAMASATEATLVSGTAMATATSASETANLASQTANNAKNTAESAMTTANAAKTTADTALEKAGSAITTATSATEVASSALATATSASSKADSAIASATEATLVSGSAIISATEATLASGSAVAAATSATQTATSASNKVDAFGDDIAAVISAADKIDEFQEAITTAIQAATTATTAAQSATTAAQTATSAAQTATSAVASIQQPNWNETDTTSKAYIQNKPTVDQTYNSTSANAQSGVAVAEAIENNEENFIAEYGVTSFDDIVQAYTDGKTLYCKKIHNIISVYYGLLVAVFGNNPITFFVFDLVTTNYSRERIVAQRDAQDASITNWTSTDYNIPTKTSDLTNDSGFITGINSSDVITALGYTPYNSSNPNGYTTNIGTVTSVNNTQPDANGNVTIQIDALPSQTGHAGDVLTTDGTDASWADTTTVYPVIETYINNGSWYRIYAPDSTGYRWCEMGGLYWNGSTLAGTNNTITFLKNFKDTAYIFSAFPLHQDANINSYSMYEKYTLRTSSSTVLRIVGAVFGYEWEAKGYIANEV